LIAVNETKPSARRPYRMRARAKAAAATGERILGAAEAVFDERPTDDFTLAEVADRAGVTVQTVLRRFGTRHGLLAATLVHVGVKMGKDRGTATSGEGLAAIGPLVDHYEKFGNRILRLLAEEERNRTLHIWTDFGRVYHRRWCEQVFAPALEGLRGVERDRRVAQFVALTDIYLWKLLRRDRGLSGRQTKLAIRELLEPLVEQAR
jgi:AcrR family transcriptional regulator